VFEIKWVCVLASGCLAVSCIRTAPNAIQQPTPTTVVLAAGRVETLNLFDQTRKRAVPVVVYWPAPVAGRAKLALLSHGYGGHNTDYSFLARHLVAQGYVVASIQHEVPTDEPIATTGNLRETRRPTWERGVQNMLFVRRQLHHTYPQLATRHLLLLGHSNGGDMAMLFAQEHLRLVEAVISLDNRRMPLPRTRHPRILSLRSSDQVADPGVLPSATEQKAFGIRIVPLPDMLHDDMWDGATEAQKQAINAMVRDFLRR
jgi:predicted dienelactone hydrolase